MAGRPWDDISSGRRVYIGNLEAGATSSDLHELCTKFGTIQTIWVARNPPGFAFVTFEDPRDAEDAVKDLDGSKFLGKHIRVEVAHGPRGNKSGRGGGGGGGGRGGGPSNAMGPFRGGGGPVGRGRSRSRSRSMSHGRGGHWSRRSPSYGRMPRPRSRSPFPHGGPGRRDHRRDHSPPPSRDGRRDDGRRGDDYEPHGGAGRRRNSRVSPVNNRGRSLSRSRSFSRNGRR